MATTLPEYWLRGAVPNISPFLQPVAHALLQSRDEVDQLMQGFPEEMLWVRPAGIASPGFHLRHLVGVLDRLFTYAEGKALAEDQLLFLKNEGNPEADEVSVKELVDAFHRQIARSIRFLEEVDEQRLTEPRGVGRAQLPSTVMGLLFHAAEHTMRHTGQLLVTVKVVKENSANHKPAL
jgi:hypothetical protein